MIPGKDGDDKWIVDPTMNKTAELQKRATAHQDAATASANSEKDAEIEELKKKIELIKTK